MSIVANVANVTIITKVVKMVHSGKLAVIQVAFNKVVTRAFGNLAILPYV